MTGLTVTLMTFIIPQAFTGKNVYNILYLTWITGNIVVVTIRQT